jgi:hypothetical protein
MNALPVALLAALLALPLHSARAQWWREALVTARPTASAVTGFIDHRVDAGLGVERSSGPVFGGALDMDLIRGTSASLRAIAGTLDPRTGPAETRTVAQVDATGRLHVLSWLDATMRGTMRSYRSDLARQKWSQVALALEGIFPIAGKVEGSFGAILIPYTRVSGHTPPDLALGGSTGLRWRADRLDIGLSYQQERYDFPGTARGERLEEQGMLMLRAGYRLSGR